VRRREFISAIAGATVWPFAARAQQPAMPVIGFIAEVPLVEPLLAAFRQAMAELGYVEGKNFAAEYRLKPESLPQAAADLQTPMVRCWRCRNVRGSPNCSYRKPGTCLVSILKWDLA